MNFRLDIALEVEKYGILNPKEKTWTEAITVCTGRAEISFLDFSIIRTKFNILKPNNFLVIRELKKFGIK